MVSSRTRIPGSAAPGLELAAGLVLGFAADTVFADPRRLHPVAGMGTVAGAYERRLHRDSRWAGTVFVAACVATTAVVVEPARRTTGVTRVLSVAAATWTVLGGTSLVRVGERVAAALERDDVDAARALIPSLCARDPESLDRAGIIRATLESIAENTSDATVAPIVWGAVAGVPGLAVYRAVNTLDAMVGYRSPRYERFGWAAARLDDVANLVPARVAGLLTALVGGAPRSTISVWRRDAHRHPSPNAGVVEASFAGALGVGLGGVTVYRHRVEERPRLGTGPAPDLADLRRALGLSRRVQLAAVVVAAAAAVVRGGRQSP